MTGVIPVSARRRGRRYDEETGKYVYDISFNTRSQVTERTVKVAEAFGLGLDQEKKHVIYRDFELELAEGDVAYITGDSGSGKSVLLHALEEDLGSEAVNIADVAIAMDKPLIDTVGATFREALTLLSKVGLNDAFLFLRRYGELSDGQRYRYKIARMIDEDKKFWLADEFCSTLDRTTAKIVAFNIQKLARRSGATLIVATTHTDLEEDLNPSILIRKGWGEDIKVEYRPNEEASICTVSSDITIREGSKEDYEELSYLHYRDSRLPVPHRIFALDRMGELIGVIAYCYSPVNAAGRKQAVGYTPRIDELNRDWTIISRVIIHPKYRTIGLGHRLVQETLPLAGRQHVELIAVMAQYNPFAERAGMKLILKRDPHMSISKAVEELKGLGFNPPLMASTSYNLRVLDELNNNEVNQVREILLGVSTQYYKRLMRTGKPYVRRVEFREWLYEQTLESLSKCLSTLSVLNQSKAYLYWCRDWLDHASTRNHLSRGDIATKTEVET
jgi:ABC-type lipoprotein export system ATPase subunit/GNAT superfamily N-acetyltransferase